MRVLHVINSLTSGGAEKLIADIVPFLKSHGVINDLYLLCNKKNHFLDRVRNYCDTVLISKRTHLLSPFHVLDILKYIHLSKPDVVHFHLFPAFYYGGFIGYLSSKTNLVLTEHNTYNRRRNYRYFWLFEKLIYSRYSKIISISNDTQKNLLNWLRIQNDDLNKFVIVNNGICLHEYKNAKPLDLQNEFNIPFSSPVGIMVGRFTEQKDQKTIIHSFEHINNNIHFLFVGEGELMGEIKKIVDEKKLSNRIHFLGFRKDVANLYKSVDFAILSSNWEGFGLVAVEKMAAGVPLITTNVSGLREIVENSALLFEVEDSINLANLIETVISNQEIRNNIISKGLIKAEDYSIEKMCKQTVDIYQELVGKKRKCPP